MATFSITPVSGYPIPPSESFPEFIQFQENGINLGGPDADTVNFANGITATRGTGEQSNVITVVGSGGGVGPITWRSITADANLVLGDAENGIAANAPSSAVITIPPHSSVAFDTGVSILVMWQSGTRPTIVPGAGVTLDVDIDFLAAVARVNGIVSLINRDVDVWVLAGDMESATGVGLGTVTAVGLDMPAAEFSVTPYEITEAGVFAVTKNPQAANTVWAGPTGGGNAAPAFRALANADMPDPARAFTWRTPPAGNYTLVFHDSWAGVVINGGIVTIPPHSDVAFLDGASILLKDNKYSDPFEIVGGAGVTVQVRAGLSHFSAGQYALVTLVQQGIDNWVIAGDLAAA